MVGFGFQEILTYSLLSLERLQNLSPTLRLKIKPLKVANPMTREQEYLRTNLRAGILTTLSRNQRYQAGGMRLFEIGKVFLPRGEELPEEREVLCAALGGPRAELYWRDDSGSLDFFDAKGIVEALMRELRLEVGFEPSDDESLAQEAGANIISENDKVGIVGLLHPKVTRVFELSGEVYLIEIDLEKLFKTVNSQTIRYQPIQRFPVVSRDIALVVDEGIAYQKIAEMVQSFPLVTEVTLFDLYRGEQIPRGKKSFALRIVYQSTERTLTDEEIGQTQQQMLDRLHQELGATLRG
jgi:phenylalanyl-tRNA synthetase beta chain